MFKDRVREQCGLTRALLLPARVVDAPTRHDVFAVEEGVVLQDLGSVFPVDRVQNAPARLDDVFLFLDERLRLPLEYDLDLLVGMRMGFPLRRLDSNEDTKSDMRFYLTAYQYWGSGFCAPPRF